MIYTSTFHSPLGDLFLAASETSLIGLWSEGQKYYRATLLDDTTLSPAKSGSNPAIDDATLWLERYFAKEQPPISDLSLAPEGTTFRKAVWDILRTIPYGEVLTYGEIARMMAQKTGKERMASQAVGGAVGHNPISIIIPCHRVVGSNASLTGYAGGIAMKEALLKHENADFIKQLS